MSTFVCEQCKKPFDSPFNGQHGGQRVSRFCTIACYRMAMAAQTLVVCSQCRRPFQGRIVSNGNGPRRQRYCSPACRSASQRLPEGVREQREREWRRREYAANKDRHRAYRKANPTVTLMGHVHRMTAFPEELRPIALLILETRRELRKRRTA